MSGASDCDAVSYNPARAVSEVEAIERAKPRGPATVSSLASDLHELGAAEGDTLLVHTSLSRLGWVAGGPIAVVEALSRVLGEHGTLVMPTHTRGLCDPSGWQDPPVPESWWPAVRAETPAFDPLTTPSAMMGVVAESFRTQPGVVRSTHPLGSFAARGPHADEIVARHPLDQTFGDGSPLGRLYDLGAKILLLGVGYSNNTSLHLAEYRWGAPTKRTASPVLREGRRARVEYDMHRCETDDFPKIGEAYAAGGGAVRAGRVGSGDATLLPMRELVDFATSWMVENRVRSV